jgi:hypothetical protein
LGTPSFRQSDSRTPNAPAIFHTCASKTSTALASNWQRAGASSGSIGLMSDNRRCARKDGAILDKAGRRLTIGALGRHSGAPAGVGCSHSGGAADRCAEPSVTPWRECGAGNCIRNEASGQTDRNDAIGRRLLLVTRHLTDSEQQGPRSNDGMAKRRGRAVVRRKLTPRGRHGHHGQRRHRPLPSHKTHKKRCKHDELHSEVAA